MIDYQKESEKKFREDINNGNQVTDAAIRRHNKYVQTRMHSSFANRWGIGNLKIGRMPKPQGKIYRDTESIKENKAPVLQKKY